MEKCICIKNYCVFSDPIYVVGEIYDYHKSPEGIGRTSFSYKVYHYELSTSGYYTFKDGPNSNILFKEYFMDIVDYRNGIIDSVIK